jgi:hypothetical protein
MFQTIIPISLYTSIEFTKTLQVAFVDHFIYMLINLKAYFIHCDLDMYDEDLDMPCAVKSWSLADDMGERNNLTFGFLFDFVY